MSSVLTYNEILFRFLNDFAGQSVVADTFFIFLAQFLIFFLLGGTIIFFSKKRDTIYEKIFVIAGSITVAWLISQFINEVFPVTRPYLALQDVYSLFEHGRNDSFPSGHATVAFALAFASFFYNKYSGLWLLIGAFLVGIARVVAGVHSPLDILGALVLALVVVALVKYLYSCVKRFSDLRH